MKIAYASVTILTIIYFMVYDLLNYVIQIEYIVLDLAYFIFLISHLSWTIKLWYEILNKKFCSEIKYILISNTFFYLAWFTLSFTYLHKDYSSPIKIVLYILPTISIALCFYFMLKIRNNRKG